MSALSLVAAQDQFTATLSAVEDAVRFAFRRKLRPQEFEEAMAEALAAAWSSWAGMIARGKDPVAAGVHGIAGNAIRYVKNRRKIGNTNCGRGAMDVYNRKAQKLRGFTVVSLDAGAEFSPEPSSRGAWRDWLAGDDRVTPADEACFRLDFEAWMAIQPFRKRQVAELLAQGHGGVEVAEALGLTPGRVSQIRTDLRADWAAFQAQADGGRRRAVVSAV
ncbi:MAG: hypothetical protein LC745_07575 [Planctomycetia bacterium]|nr:hypothetical protein [Planctomycetia bacterium]